AGAACTLARPASAPAAGDDVHRAARHLLRLMEVPSGPRTADGPVWSPLATGFASVPTPELPHGAVGGLGGAVATARDAADLARLVALEEPVVVLVRGTIELDPGTMLDVASDTSVLGVGRDAEIVGGGLRLVGVGNVVVRNLTFRDSYVPGDWDGKSRDVDGLRLDGCHHVWIDHCELARLGDGLVDVRKDSTATTLSWTVLRDHNKALGVGWTDNVVATLTVHHCWFSNTYQRNGSIDNVAAGHLYNNYLHGQAHYGTMARGRSRLLVEHSVYADGEDAVVAKDPDSRVHSRDNRFDGVRGRKDDTGPTFEARDHYPYTADPTDDVVRLVTAHAGPAGRRETTPRTLRVALDGSGDVASIGAALGLAWRARHATEVVIAPGTYREVVRIWPGTPEGLVLRGESGEAADVVISYDLAAGAEKFYGGTQGRTGAATLAVLADGVTLRDLTVENAYDEATHGPSQAQALRTVGDRVVLDSVHLLGNQDTFLAETPGSGVVSRVYVTDSLITGDVDFVYGSATLVVEHSEIRSLDRGEVVNGYVCAPSTEAGVRGFLFDGCTFTSSAAPGTVFLGRPWHPSSNPDVEPSAVVRDSSLGAHIRTPAWSDMGGWPWQEDFLREHANTGPGALQPGDDPTGRPQLLAPEVAEHTRETYLSGQDDWRPWR
uniref:pectinesterase family protein n=1 Tax=Desertihabitans aurantiacus TaxID=2282477 RepID=UPI000DF72C31